MVLISQMMGWDKLSRFMGPKQVTSSAVHDKKESKPCEDGVPSGDVPIAILANRITAESDDAKKAVIEQQLLKELQVIETKILCTNLKFSHYKCCAYNVW